MQKPKVFPNGLPILPDLHFLKQVLQNTAGLPLEQLNDVNTPNHDSFCTEICINEKKTPHIHRFTEYVQRGWACRLMKKWLII